MHLTQVIEITSIFPLESLPSHCRAMASVVALDRTQKKSIASDLSQFHTLDPGLHHLAYFNMLHTLN